MLPPEIKAQVIAVLQARQLEDKAYRAVMDISKKTPQEEAEQIAAEFEKCARLVTRQERTLANMVIKEHNTESEAVPNDSVTQ
jgi:hypothetical protein